MLKNIGGIGQTAVPGLFIRDSSGRQCSNRSFEPINQGMGKRSGKRAAVEGFATEAAAGAVAVQDQDVATNGGILLPRRWPGAVEVDAEAPARPDEAPGEPKATRRRRRGPDPLPCTDPTPELLGSLAAYVPPPRPIPNLGYACLCMELRELKPAVFISRDCIKRTLDEKGLPYLGGLCLANCRDLARVIQWNHEHGIRFFRMSSVLWPWMGAFLPQELPQFNDIAAALRFAGELARKYDQRLTFHPSHFVKLAAPVEALVEKSIRELEAHSQILDLMGFEPSPENKLNIHIGGVYPDVGDKQDTMQRWAANYRRLSPTCQKRMTCENDDTPSAFSLEDLLSLHRMCGVPLVFDFHHHRFCPGSLTEEQALRAAIATWPTGVRPVVHWSESPGPGRIPHAHSDYVRGPIDGATLHGLEAEVDVMIESKCKERALLALRSGCVPQDEWVLAEGVLPGRSEGLRG